jgi:hypothetical protein
MPDIKKLMHSIEIHSPEGIRKYFQEGGNPNEVHDGVPLFTSMIEMYTRTPRFRDCVNEFLIAGLEYSNQALLSVFRDKPEELEEFLQADPDLVNASYSLYNNTYTPLTGASLLHFCAEYNSTGCARLLVEYGADVNARAAFDEFGFGGQTPIFHAVNQNNNNSFDTMNFLLENSADLTVTVRGIVWGKGYDWETWIPAVNPISYAMMGMLPQMHRDEKTIAEIVSLLVKRAYNIDYIPLNIPCAYLTH